MSRQIQVRQPHTNKSGFAISAINKYTLGNRYPSIMWNRIEYWMHLKCPGICQAQYTDTWTFHLHRESGLHTHNTTPQSTHYKTADTDIQHCIQYITNIPHSVLTGDVNAHSTLWHSYTDHHKGQLIADVISNSDHITLHSAKHYTTTNIITRYHNGV